MKTLYMSRSAKSRYEECVNITSNKGEGVRSVYMSVYINGSKHGDKRTL